MDLICKITFPTTSFPISPKGSQILGHWTRYEKAWEDEKTTITVTPELKIRQLTDLGQTIYRDLNLYFDPKQWNTEVYGLVYTDPVFENAVEKWWQDTCQFPENYGTPFYTEQGMQGDDYISMELKTIDGLHPWWAGFKSAHEAMDMLRANPKAQAEFF